MLGEGQQVEPSLLGERDFRHWYVRSRVIMIKEFAGFMLVKIGEFCLV